MAVRWLYIWTMVVWGASWFDLVMGPYQSSGSITIDQLIESFVMFAGWLFERSSSGSGNGPLLPACLPAYLPTCLPACLPACLPTCLPACLPVSVSGSIWGRGRPNWSSDWFESFSMAICWLYSGRLVAKEQWEFSKFVWKFKVQSPWAKPN